MRKPGLRIYTINKYANQSLHCSMHYVTDRLELKIGFKQPSTNTQSHMITLYSGFKMLFLNTERRTIRLR